MPDDGPERQFAPGSPGRGRVHRRSRGLLRAAILLLLAEEPMHGYQIITELAERTDGSWRPSAGAVYPTLAQLVDEGLVTVADDAGRRVASLTDSGASHVAEHRDRLGTPWAHAEPGAPPGLANLSGPDAHGSPTPGRLGAQGELGAAGERLWATVQHAHQIASPAEAAAIAVELDQVRRNIHRILADGAGPNSR